MKPSPEHAENASHSVMRPLQASAPLHPGMNRVLFLLTLSILINYVDRSNLSIAAPLLQDELHISNTQLGTLLAAFFWTYGLMQIPAGWLVDHFDVKWVFAAGFFIWSTATAVTGLLHGFAALIAVRVVLGIGESVAFPSYSNIIGRHFTEERRGFPNALVAAGLSLGPAVGMLIGGMVVESFGWRPFFVVVGLAALLWIAPWLAWMPSKAPRTHAADSQAIGIAPILRQRSAWGTCLGQFCINYFLYFLLTWLPTYLKHGRGFSMDDVAKDCCLLFLMSAISATIWGKLSDWWIEAGATPTLVRKGSITAAHAGIGICLVLIAVTQGRLFIGTLALTGTFLGVCCSSWTITQALAGPHGSGRWAGVQNFVGNFAGWVAPLLTGFLLDRTGQYYWAFFITGAVAWIGAASWGLVVERVEPVDWERLASRAKILVTPAVDTPLP
jgi:MFS transporter, ACS family, D-galactonate transporter